MAMTISVGDRSFAVPDKVFLDASLLIDVLAPSAQRHEAAMLLLKRLLQGAASGVVALYVTPLVLDEVWWGLAKVAYEDQQGRGAWRRLGKAGRRLTFTRCARALAQGTQWLLEPGVVRIADVTADDVGPALARVTHPEAPLEPRDAFHLAVMARLGIGAIATADADFGAVGSVAVIDFHQASA